MKRYGDKSTFAIEYEFMPDEGNSFCGQLSLWAGGKNLCRYDKAHAYCGDLFYIVDWFCDKIDYIFGFDAFPLPVQGDTTLELLRNAGTFESEDELESDLWYSARNRWIFDHCWVSVMGGAPLPYVYFRRNGHCVEVSWDNKPWMDHNITFESMDGAAMVPRGVFLNTLEGFLFDAIGDMEKRIGKCNALKDAKRKITILRGGSAHR